MLLRGRNAENEKVLSSKEHSTQRECWAGGRGHGEKYAGLASSPVIFLTENEPERSTSCAFHFLPASSEVEGWGSRDSGLGRDSCLLCPQASPVRADCGASAGRWVCLGWGVCSAESPWVPAWAIPTPAPSSCSAPFLACSRKLFWEVGGFLFFLASPPGSPWGWNALYCQRSPLLPGSYRETEVMLHGTKKRPCFAHGS